jgi:hypothetical protein
MTDQSKDPNEYHDSGESQRIRLELGIVTVALRSIVRQAITRLQYEQICANSVTMNNAEFELSTTNADALEDSLQQCCLTMRQLLDDISQVMNPDECADTTR